MIRPCAPLLPAPVVRSNSYNVSFRVGSYPALDQDGDIEYLYREGVRVEKMRPSLSTRIANDRT